MIGKSLSHYEVLEQIGEGGMGVVYKAHDTVLNRQVAVKALPAGKATDPERRARFLQEAQAASALNHPNIVTIHDVLSEDGRDFIVMELVPGSTLDQVIPAKGMRLADALKYAVQVAGALEAAHEAGIVHRDLKPGNIMVGHDGRVRVLDFGLAKLMAPSEPSTVGATRTRQPQAAPETGEGQILGTVSYMSPEQAEGRAVDARSDVFSFGAVLYEMVAGDRPFRGDSNLKTLAAIIKDDPEPLPADLPHDLEKLIHRCLRKDPDRRIRHMSEVRLALQDLKEESDSGKLSGVTQAGGAARPHRTFGWPTVSALGIAVLGAALWWWSGRQGEEPEEALREVPFTAEAGHEGGASFSADGSTVVFSRFPGGGGPGSIEVKMIGAEGALVLKKPATWPVSSPDGRWIAFTNSDFGSERTVILTMPRIGGPERRIAEVGMDTYPDRFVSWTPDGKWLVSQDRNDPKASFHIVLVSVETGEKRRLTSPPSGILGDSGPAVSPDGKTLAFTRHTFWGASDLYLLSLDAEYRPASDARRLTTDVPNANCAVWTPDGREVVFCSRVWHAATLWRVRADGSAPPKPLILGGRGAYLPDIARTGNRLVYTKQVWDTNVWRLELLPSGLPAGAPQSFIQSNLLDQAGTFSPDGTRVAFVSERSGVRQLWVADARGADPRPLTSMESSWGMEPEWSPDGEEVAFRAEVSGSHDIYVVGVRGEAPRRLASDPAARYLTPRWSRDGQWIDFESERGGQSRVWRVARGGGEATLAEPQRIGREDADGAFRYFVKEAKTGLSIWRQPTAGGAESLVTDGVASGGFALTRRGIYFSAGGREGVWRAASIVFREFATGKTTKVVDLKVGTGSGGGLAVSPDERYLLYTQCDQESSDLMLVENFR